MTRPTMLSIKILTIILFGVWTTTVLAEEKEAAGEGFIHGVVQILTYDDDDLITQGSGIVVGENMILTSHHLSYKAKQMRVRDAQGREATGEIAVSKDDFDVVLLRLPSGHGLGIAPAQLSFQDIKAKESATLMGYWKETMEDKRSGGLFSAKRPTFRAEVQVEVQKVTGFVEALADGYLDIYAAMGRGGYGAAVLNDCRQITGMIRLAPDIDIKQAWKRHQPSLPLTALSLGSLKTLLLSEGVSFSVAEAPCLDAVALMKSEQDALAKKQAALKEKLTKVDQEKKAAEEEAEKTRQKAEEDQQKSQEALKGMGQRLQENEGTLQDATEENAMLQTYAVMAGGLLLGVIILIWLKKNSRIKKVSEELEEAEKSYHDCLLKGVDSNGNPVALRISGRDLMRSAQGLIIGRNPENTGLVLSDETVSRNHARIFVREGDLYIEELGSTGGTQVSGIILQPGEPRIVSDGDVLSFANVHLDLKVLP